MKAGWEIKRLEDVATLQRGFDLPKRSRVTGIHPLMSSSGRIDTHNVAKVRGPGVVTGRSGSVGAVFYVTDDFWPLNTVLYIKNFHGNHPRYIFQLLNFLEPKRFASGSGVPTLNRNHIHGELVPVPPLTEQEEIVEVLDKAFAAIDQAKANLEQNIANAKELFQSKLNQIFSQKGAGWVETSLGSATGGVSTGPFGSLLHKKDYIENGIPLINPAHITDTGIEPAQNKTVTSETADRLSNYQLGKGDIVIARRGEMGRCAVVTNREVGWLCGTGSFFIKPSETSDPQYLVNLLRSTVYREKLDQIAGGATMKNLSNKSLSSFLIPLPPLPEQKTIVQHLDTLSAQTRALESHYQTKLTSLEELKKSLLQKAFAGELT